MKDEDKSKEELIKELQDLRRKSENPAEPDYKILFEAAHDGIVLHPLGTEREQCRFTRFNAVACRMLGYTEEGMAQLSPLDIQVTDGLATVPAEAAQMERNRQLRFEKTLVAKDGRRFPAEIRSTIFDLHGQTMVLSIIRDVSERKRDEEALRQSQRMFAELIECAQFGIYVVDTQFRIAHMNTSSQNGAFRNVQPVIGRDLAEVMRILWPEEVAREISGVFRHTLETGEPYYSPRFTNPRADVGITESYEWELHRMTLSDGQYGVICYYYDSTKLREAEATVRESEQRVVGVLESMPYAFVSFDADMRYTYVNANAERLQAVCREELLGKDVRVVYPDAESYKTISLYERAIVEQKPVTSTSYHAGFGGWVEVRAFPTPDGVSVFYKDVSPRVKAEMALRESEEMFRRFFDNAPLGKTLTTPEGGLERVNPVLCRMLGYSAEELANVSLVDITHPDDLPMSEECTRSLLAGERDTWDMQKRYRARDGRIVWTQVVTTLLRDSQGQPLRFLTHILDITERKRAEEEQAATVKLLEIANQARKPRELAREAIDFLANLSGCSVIGLRMREGDDYPYYDQRGMTDEFLCKENTLFRIDRDGKIATNVDGKPYISCMCGNVLCGRTDPSKPFFTRGGSFWTNSTTHLLATTTSTDRQAETRNVCNQVRWESLALVPLRIGDDTFGLIHLADPQIGKFSGEMIALFERLAQQLATSLGKLRAEEALAAAHGQIQSIIDNTPALVYAFDLEERFVLANSALAELLSSTPEQMIGKRRHEFMPKEDADWHETNDREAIEAGRALEFEEYSQLKGRSITWLTTKFPLRDVQGRIVAVAGISSDISERKQAEMELKRMRNLLAEGEKIAQMGTFEYIADTKTTVWSEQEYHIYGLDPSGPSPAYNDMLANCIHPDYADQLHETFSRAMQSNSIYEFEHKIVHPDGSSRWVHDRALPYFDETGKLTRYIGATLDITERKLMEDELRKSRDELEQRVQERTAELMAANRALKEQAALLELAHDAIFVHDMEGHVLYWNSGAEKTYGWSKEEALGKLTHALLHTRFPVPLEEILGHLLEIGQWEGELDHETRSGRPVVVASRWGIQRDEDGHPTGVLEINRDVNERKKSEEQIKSYMARLEQSNQALQDFASIASHDLQEPLRKVSSFGNMLKQKHGEAIGEGGKDYLDRMLSATDRMQILLRSLLDYSHVSTKAEPLKEVQLSSVIEEVLSDLEVRIENCGGKVEVGELPVVQADPTQMRQLFQNLIGNALKFHKAGENPMVKVHGSPDGPAGWQITIEDNGIGFEEKYLERIFAPFQRLHGKSSQYEGTGMGLAICRKIVERHGGAITAKSTPGSGSIFTITLPKDQS